MEYGKYTDRELLLITAQRTERIERTIDGNGQPGLISRMATVEEGLENLESPPRNRTPVVGGVAGVISVVIVSIFEALRRIDYQQERAWSAPVPALVSKDVPQAHVLDAFGLLTENPCFITSSI